MERLLLKDYIIFGVKFTDAEFPNFRISVTGEKRLQYVITLNIYDL